jgi:beta-lactam-binding protein with PASTA domain
MLAGSGTIQKSEPTVPDFRGLTLKQSMQKAKYLGLIILPVGTSGRVVWQSISPGQLVNHTPKCTIKLEAM